MQIARKNTKEKFGPRLILEYLHYVKVMCFKLETVDVIIIAVPPHEPKFYSILSKSKKMAPSKSPSKVQNVLGVRLRVNHE